MNKKISLLILVMMIGLVGFVNSEIETYKVNTVTNLQFTCTLNNAIPSAGTTFNITITDRNGSYLVKNQQATAEGQGAFNYTVTFPTIETYKVQMFCTDGTYSFSDEGYYNITGNGKDDPSGIVIVFFGILLIIILSSATYVMVYSIGHAVTLDFDIIDAAINYGIFFALVAIYLLSNAYLGNPEILNILDWTLDIGIFVLMVLPTIYFILTLTIGTWLSKRVKGVDF